MGTKIEKIKWLFFETGSYGELRMWALFSILGLVACALVSAGVGINAWITSRDCQALCEAAEAKPVWTLSEGCSCLKNGELKNPTASPQEIRLR